MSLLLVKDVAKRLGISESTVRKLCRTGVLKSVKLGRILLIEEGSFNVYRESITAAEAPAAWGE